MAPRKSPPASMRRVERKVDQLAEGQQQLSDRVDNLNLNGSASTLKSLAGAAPALLTLAQNADSLVSLAAVAPDITAAVKRDAEWATWWKVTRRILNPLKPLGAAVWTIAAGVVIAIVAARLS